jgi:transposase
VELVASHPFDTAAKIAERIHEDLKLRLSTSTVRFWMRRQGITYKKAARYVMTQDVEDKRIRFAQEYSAVYDPARVVSIDESSFYFDMSPSRGHCHRSQRLRVPARKGGRTRWSLLMAVSDEQVVGWKLVKGSINSRIFSEFMATLDTRERDVMLLDNCSIHKTRLAQETMISRGLTPCFLPPYSPEFQPIEHCFSVLKGAFRRTTASASNNTEMEADVLRRLETCLPALTTTTLHNQFEACWARAAQYASQGARAIQGAQASQGARAIQGAQASQGARAIQGAQATQGARAIQGARASQGARAIQGAGASQGARASQGVRASQGARASQGTRASREA